MQFQYLTTLLAVSGAALALPTTTPPTNSLGKRDATQVLLDIMPKSSSCEGRGEECRTAVQAGPYLVQAMTKYKIATDMEQAGILALVGFESEDMQYKKNLAHAAEGQGTSNQQQGKWNVMYANSIPELASLGLTETTVLDQVIDDKYNFGTGPWFYSTQCQSAHAAADGPADDWFAAYMACVNTDLEPRKAYWNRAKTAFGLA